LKAEIEEEHGHFTLDILYVEQRQEKQPP